jgi:hypothetical protein
MELLAARVKKRYHAKPPHAPKSWKFYNDLVGGTRLSFVVWSEALSIAHSKGSQNPYLYLIWLDQIDVLQK